jgi:hypothetical protein
MLEQTTPYKSRHFGVMARCRIHFGMSTASPYIHLVLQKTRLCVALQSNGVIKFRLRSVHLGAFIYCRQ